MNNVNTGINDVLSDKPGCTYTADWVEERVEEAKAWAKTYGAACTANQLPDNDPYFGTAKQVCCS